MNDKLRLALNFKSYSGSLTLPKNTSISKDFLEHLITHQENEITYRPKKKPYKRNNKNSIKGIDLNIISYQYFEGVDLFEIPGVSFSTVISLMSEIRPEGFSRFPTAKHFASWLRLAPSNRMSGGKGLSYKIPKGSNRLKIALRMLQMR